MEKSLLVGCDEFTVVLHLNFPIDAREWEENADEFISEFVERSRIEELFGLLIKMDYKIPAGYTRGWTIENVTWYFAIAMHENYQNMGVCVRFSAEAWAWYQRRYRELYREEINVAAFYQMIQSDMYDTRLTRIDFTADYINYDENLSPDSIFDSLINKRVLIMDCKGRVARRKLTHYGKDGIVESILIGSRAENTKSICRIYDKRLEQIQKSGFRLEEALKCEAWTRFEASYRGEYAWQIAEDLLVIDDDIEFSQYIASKIADKYRFFSVSDNEYTLYSNDLLKIIDNGEFSSLRTETPKDNYLWETIHYLMEGSGLFSTMYKIKSIWDDYTVLKFLCKLYERFQNVYLHKAVTDKRLNTWCEKHYQSLHNTIMEDYFDKNKFARFKEIDYDYLDWLPREEDLDIYLITGDYKNGAKWIICDTEQDAVLGSMSWLYDKVEIYIDRDEAGKAYERFKDYYNV